MMAIGAQMIYLGDIEIRDVIKLIKLITKLAIYISVIIVFLM